MHASSSITAAHGLRWEQVRDVGAVASEWDRLAEAAGNPYVSHLWADAWCRHFARGRRRLTVAARDDDGALVAMVSLYLWRARPLRIARLIGHGLGAHLEPACAPGDRARVAAALPGLLVAAGVDLLVCEGLPAEHGWATLAGARVLRRSASPLVRLSELDWDGFLASRSTNFRQQVRRRERKLGRERELSLRQSDDPARLDADMDVLMRLHEARWKGESVVFAGPNGRFHREVAAGALARGWLRLWFLELEGVAVAAWHGFRLGAVEWYYQAGRAPEAAGESAGSVLLMHTVREATLGGASEYRLGNGGEGYKQRLADEDPGVEWALLSSGWAGRAAVAVAARALAVAPLRRRIRRGLTDGDT